MNEQTLEKLKEMKLYGMARVFTTSLESKTEQLTTDEIVSSLVDAEWDERYNRKLTRSVQRARFRYKASVEQITFAPERELNKNHILRLADCQFIKKAENVIITGSTGIGKSYIASALGHQACSLGYRVQYEQSSKLFARLKMAKADGSYLKEIARIDKMHVLILDDFGIQPLDAQSRTSLMEIAEDRHGKTSIIFTSQVPVSKWFEIIGEQTIADAILDRIIHNAHRLELTGDSMRKKRMLAEETN